MKINPTFVKRIPTNERNIMKKTTITLMLLFLTCIAWAQDNKTRIAELGKIAGDQFRNQQYDDALTNYQKGLSLIQKEYGENDSLYVDMLAVVSRCYYRQKAYKMALESGLKAADIYGNHYSKDNVYYANLLDNVALYYTCVNDLANAEKCSDEALKIYYKFFTNDRHMGGTLSHAAEIKYSLGKYAEAVALQEHALTLIENDEGAHSNHYLNELKYMKMYYDKVGNTAKVEEMETLESQLEDEMEHGYVPPLLEFKTAEKCREHNADAYYCSLYYLNHYLSAEKMQQAAHYIHAWSLASPDVMVYIGEAETKWATDEKNYGYLIAYLAACTKYALSHDPVVPVEQYSNAIVDVLNYYRANKEITGEVPAFEEYIKLYKKDPEKLFERLRKDYEALQKAKDQGKGATISTREDS